MNNNFTISHRICLSKNRWQKNRENCSCFPQCNSIDYSFVRTFFPASETRFITTIPRVSGTRLKRDIKFDIHYLIGAFQLIPINFWFSNISIFFIGKRIVSIGGAAALFLGCSFISVAELFYFAIEYLFRINYPKRRPSVLNPIEIDSNNRNRHSISSNRCMTLNTYLTNRFNYFVNNSGLHGIRYLDRRYGLIDR